ncbi:methyltransferase [Turicibacter sanguinis]|uniref:class I SAM-dependent DNA methyltransferase n=1 Tax=Turicibacter sanguinis TaxID=154288 RepID=UPI00105004D8|nr:class I SAM-dependent methyltransferase [Turicibacter sanguinis]MCU7210340.1 class I SAM-dependent methyltransferase [Turicibacter sanguinis]MTN79751.1 methyltransferase [Turicibacter sanguinis]MTN82895.1 methyltransferase [Turicibacter sanguinis]MTN85475.1 methyltransferase [Turicibacter sanguinis]MTN88622.1 methyltransferase [Turicibacter sanguinis]
MDFNALSPNWDTDLRVKRAEAISAEIESYLGSGPLEMMEFGCGTGLISFHLKNKKAQFLLIDNSEGRIKEVEQKINESDLKNMKTYCGELKDLETDTKFDVIYTSMVLHHIEDVQSTVNLLASHLKPNGKLIIVDLLPDDGTFHNHSETFKGHHGFSINEMKEYLEAASLQNISGRKFYSSYKMVDDMNHPYSLFSIYATK